MKGSPLHKEFTILLWVRHGNLNTRLIAFRQATWKRVTSFSLLFALTLRCCRLINYGRGRSNDYL